MKTAILQIAAGTPRKNILKFDDEILSNCSKTKILFPFLLKTPKTSALPKADNHLRQFMEQAIELERMLIDRSLQNDKEE
jgi:hypothetical protein